MMNAPLIVHVSDKTKREEEGEGTYRGEQAGGTTAVLRTLLSFFFCRDRE